MGPLFAIALAILAAVPAAAMHLGLIQPPVEIATLLNAMAIVGASFALAWAAEAAERDIPRALALTGSSEALPPLRARRVIETSAMVKSEIADAIGVVTP